MKSVIQSRDFKRDLKHLASGKYRNIINGKLRVVVGALANDEQLDYLCHDHALIGNLKGYRECHLAFDLVLVYKLEDDAVELARIGSHSEVLGL
ncbi:MAG: type II toxin-antitoxin system YafQ family toxin [Synergistaceae bacterium]|nr:type II toxin-antitoxin system YafQ family toxin [Synergistaceae bacterium]MBR0094844.1 type II toxin-antitoxin system YafQ family toxin [Synergistaceae bacterium]